ADGGRRHGRRCRIAAAGGSPGARTRVDADRARARAEQPQTVRRCEARVDARARPRARERRCAGGARGGRKRRRRAGAGGGTRAVVAPLGVLMLAAAMTRAASPPVLFRDITAEAGIAFQHHAAPEKKYIVESMAGGVALFDFDRDGLTDIYFVDSLTVDTANS